MKKFFISLVLVFGFIVVASAAKYEFTCVPHAYHFSKDRFKKFNSKQLKKIGLLGFTLDTSKGVLVDATNDTYKYITSVKTKNNPVDIYTKDKTSFVIPSTIEKYVRAGLFIKGKEGWTEFICKTEETPEK